MRKRPIRQTFVLKLYVRFPSPLSLTQVDSATFFESYRPSRAPNGALSPARIVDPTLERRPESRTNEQATCDASNSGTSRVRAPETLRTPDHSVSSRELPVEVFHCRPIRDRSPSYATPERLACNTPLVRSSTGSSFPADCDGPVPPSVGSPAYELGQ